MTFHFTLEQKIKALELIGYEVRVEKEEDVRLSVGSYEIKRDIEVYRVYRNGERVGWFSSSPDSEVNFIFKEELERRLLGLFR